MSTNLLLIQHVNCKYIENSDKVYYIYKSERNTQYILNYILKLFIKCMYYTFFIIYTYLLFKCFEFFHTKFENNIKLMGGIVNQFIMFCQCRSKENYIAFSSKIN